MQNLWGVVGNMRVRRPKASTGTQLHTRHCAWCCECIFKGQELEVRVSRQEENGKGSFCEVEEVANHVHWRRRDGKAFWKNHHYHCPGIPSSEKYRTVPGPFQSLGFCKDSLLDLPFSVESGFMFWEDAFYFSLPLLLLLLLLLFWAWGKAEWGFQAPWFTARRLSLPVRFSFSLSSLPPLRLWQPQTYLMKTMWMCYITTLKLRSLIQISLG